MEQDGDVEKSWDRQHDRLGMGENSSRGLRGERKTKKQQQTGQRGRIKQGQGAATARDGGKGQGMGNNTNQNI